jgi:predicted amidophosphoribosyltransferase
MRQELQTNPVYCIQCKTEIDANASFCQHCGQAQDRETVRAQRLEAAARQAEEAAREQAIRERAAQVAAEKIVKEVNLQSEAPSHHLLAYILTILIALAIVWKIISL